MSGMVTLEVRVMARRDRFVLVEHDGVQASVPIAAIDIAPGLPHPWATLTIGCDTALAYGLISRRALPEPEPLITHHHTDIQPGDRCA